MHEQPPAAANPDALHDLFEQDQQASLFEQNADEVFDLYGHHGTLRELIILCPVPAEQRSFAATERFTAKVLEQHGVEIPEQFAHLRSPEKTKEKAEQIEAKVAETKKPELAKSAVPVEAPKVARTLPDQLPHENVAKFEAARVVEEIGLTSKPPERVHDEPAIGEVSAHMSGVSAHQIEAMRVATEEQVSEQPKVIILPIMPSKPKSKVAHQPQPKMQPVEAQLIESPAVLDSELSIDTAPMVAVPSVAEYVGALYQEAASEVRGEISTDQETETSPMNELIAEILGLSVEELQTPQDETMALPPTPEDSILNMLSIPHNEVDSIAQPAPEFVTPQILEIIPEPLLVSYKEQRPQLPVEEAEHLESLVETMTVVAERLQVLVADNREASPEAIQIEAVLEEYYDELCGLLGMPVDTEERRQFIARVRIGEVSRELETESTISDDEGTHEQKHGMLAQAHSLPVLLHQTVNLARYMISLGLSQPLPSS